MGVDREDSGAMPDTSTIPTKHIKGVFCGGDIGSIHIRNRTGENRGGSLE